MKSISWMFIFCSVFCHASTVSHLSPKHRYAVLTGDYGILNDNDVWISEQIAIPVAFSEESISYSYWQCFPSENFKFGCTDESEDGKQQASGSIDVVVSRGIHEWYVMNGMLPGKTCDLVMRKIKKLVSGSPFTCIAGWGVGTEAERQDGQKIHTRSWIYDRIKTKKGCLSWFEDYCDVNYWKKQLEEKRHQVSKVHSKEGFQ